MTTEPTWMPWPDDLEDNAPGVAIEIEIMVPKLDHRGRVRYGAPVDRWWIEVMPMHNHWEWVAYLMNEDGDTIMKSHGNAATMEDAQADSMRWRLAQEQAWQDEIDDIQRYGREP